MSFKFNIVQNEGEPSSVYVFVGKDQYLATAQHPNFKRILDTLRGSEPVEDSKLVGLFDTGIAIRDGFAPLSERITVSHGMLYFDGDPMDSSLSKTILRFYSEGNDDFKPLVNFLEKIMTNPAAHSREHLFRWLRDKQIGICPDGDFIAYKGLSSNDHSVHAGTAMVNGKVIQGKIPNKPDTVIEMPRSKVVFDPEIGCSTGLHAGNWRYARAFSQAKVVIVKINPRDVVSVPVDSSDEKLRVCRYRVLRPAQMEDKAALFLNDPERTAKVWAPSQRPSAGKAAAAKIKKNVVTAAKIKKNVVTAGKAAKNVVKATKPKPENFPGYYEEFTKKHWQAVPVSELRWVGKEWDIKGYSKMPVADLIQLLQKEARARKRTW